MSKRSLRRYTNLAAMLQILQDRCLTLLNPSTWDDRNDAFYMEEYRRQKRASSVLALCFAEASETYHHWRVFSSGADGICLEIDKAELESALDKDSRIAYRSVDYRKIDDVKGTPLEDLPFVKRFPYQDEKEFRAVFLDIVEMREFMPIPIPMRALNRITLSPWMPGALVDAVKRTLKSIKGCSHVKIYRSTLIDNERWKKAANPKLKIR